MIIVEEEVAVVVGTLALIDVNRILINRFSNPKYQFSFIINTWKLNPTVYLSIQMLLLVLLCSRSCSFWFCEAPGAAVHNSKLHSQEYTLSVIIITDITFTLRTLELARIIMSVKIMSVALRSMNYKVRYFFPLILVCISLHMRRTRYACS